MPDLSGTVSRVTSLSALEAKELKRVSNARGRAARIAAMRREAMEEFAETESASLRRIREAADVPQKKMARVAGVPRAYVSYLENGEVGRIPDAALWRLLKAYNEL